MVRLALAIEWLPAAGAAEQLILLLHGAGSGGAAMAPLAQALRAEFPQAALIAPDAPLSSPEPAGRRQWFSTDDDRGAGVAAALPGFVDWVRRMQRSTGVGPAATALAGCAQGATLALETAIAHDGLAGRVLAFGGRFAAPPAQAPRETTVHLFHGDADPAVACAHSRTALQQLAALHGDATLDIADGVADALHPVLLRRALFRLRNHIPARTWAAALGALPGLQPPPQQH